MKMIHQVERIAWVVCMSLCTRLHQAYTLNFSRLKCGAYSRAVLIQKLDAAKKKTLKKCKKCKLMIIVVNALSYPWYCLTTDQLFHRRATQTNETNIVNET